MPSPPVWFAVLLRKGLFSSMPPPSKRQQYYFPGKFYLATVTLYIPSLEKGYCLSPGGNNTTPIQSHWLFCGGSKTIYSRI